MDFIKKIKHIQYIIAYCGYLYSAIINIQSSYNTEYLFHQLYQGRHTLCVTFAASWLWPTEWDFLSFLELDFFSCVICAGASTPAARLFVGGCSASSLGKLGDALASLDFGALDVAIFLSSGPAAGEASLRASSRASRSLGPLSVVLKASSRLRERQSLLESCDNIQRSFPFKLSAISR